MNQEDLIYAAHKIVLDDAILISSNEKPFWHCWTIANIQKKDAYELFYNSSIKPERIIDPAKASDQGDRLDNYYTLINLIRRELYTTGCRDEHNIAIAQMLFVQIVDTALEYYHA